MNENMKNMEINEAEMEQVAGGIIHDQSYEYYKECYDLKLKYGKMTQEEYDEKMAYLDKIYNDGCIFPG